MNIVETKTMSKRESGLQWLIFQDESGRSITNFADGRPGDASSLVTMVNARRDMNHGHDDWRLPSIEDLETLIGSEGSPSSGIFWSCSICEENERALWCLRFPDGLVDADWPSVHHKVRLVRTLS